METIRVGIVGLGANTRLRHVPGLRACSAVEITAVCNRRRESTRVAAEQFSIPRSYNDWRDLVADPDLDAIVVGTWPALHAEVTLAALEHGKHVLTEARMAANAEQARQMLAASRRHPELVTQIVPSPLGLKVHRVLVDLLASGYLGQLQEVVVLGVTDAFADPNAPRHWRQSARDSGVNMLALGILHETLTRWVPDPVRVYAHAATFTELRRDEETSALVPVEIPDTIQLLTQIPGGARGMYHLSNVANFGPGLQIHLYGNAGTLKLVSAAEEQLFGARRGESQLREIPIPDEKAGRWRVEEEFIEAIRGCVQIQFTDFATGVRYMEFTEAVAHSIRTGTAVGVPLDKL